MNINEHIDQLADKKKTLLDAVQNAITKFEDESGLSVERIEVIRTPLGYGDKVLVGLEAIIKL